ncbi:unnamed protein product [Caenorhabditis auriculariae]|uniref:Rap-GAP domain-containing protein n=1 Tax=Caenorhabditis auriculariae TaxID=2777116 RepID=A0A8S1HTA6_9PELO|nr:unnamed protein product [Caenorhabditis auriculariae]
MFARKGKSSDIQASIQRFTDLNRDCVSRVKHLKILLDTLTLNEKRQLLGEHSFETFHLVDELLLATDIDKNPQLEGAIEAESGLWTLEQVLCLAPELVGSGWQRHAIESLLKKAIFPKNLLAVRKIAIRLFLIFYQCLGVHGKATADLDRVFQCLLPFFPLKGNENTEDVLTEYCQSAGSLEWNEKVNSGKITSSSSSTLSAKERAQMLQVYLDKFLEYCTRETVRIEWSDEGRRLECAKFIIDKVIKHYMGECFEELETNGVDVFGGWEGAEEVGEPLDTADPVVIARYWLIRWINNLASASQHGASQQTAHSALLLYHQALFFSHKATNVALTLMREAMTLPLACSNVTHKVVSVISTWLLQYEIPPFVATGEVSIERSSLLLANILLGFFHSAYLSQCGDRQNSAVSISFAILSTFKQLVAVRMQLPKPLSSRFWTELSSGICRCATKICSQSDPYSQSVAAAFTSTLLSNTVIVKAVRRIDMDDSVWDDVHNVLQRGVWISMAEQWAAIVLSVTRALILHLAHVDIFSREEVHRRATDNAVSRRQAETASVEDSRKFEQNGDVAEDNVFHDTDDITNAVSSWSGDKTTWLLTWKRLISLVNPYTTANGPIAIQAITQTIQHLLSVSLYSLAHWLASRLVVVPLQFLPQCVPALSLVLSVSVKPPPLLAANIIQCFILLLRNRETQVLSAICSLTACELSIIAPYALENCSELLPTLQNDSLKTVQILRLFAMFAPSFPAAEEVLLNQLATTEVSLSDSLMIVKALIIIILQRAQIDLLISLMKIVESHRFAVRILPLFSSCLPSLARFGFSNPVLQVLLRSASMIREERIRTEVEWMMGSLCLSAEQPELGTVLRGILGDRQMLLQGELVTLSGQFPLPGFNVSKWNSVEPTTTSTDRNVFVNRNSSIISVNREAQCELTCRTVVGRHCWTLDTHVAPREKSTNVTTWLRKEANRGRKSGRENLGILGAMDDPFDELPECSSPSPSETWQVDSSQWAAAIEESRRQPQALRSVPLETPTYSTPSRILEWRSCSASLGLVPSVCEVPPNFSRDLKHLDQTCSREVHKVAVIYVGEGQDEKTSILSNTTASAEFDTFVAELGWEVRVGRGHEGYPGGLPGDTSAPYYADADSEVVFHVSTALCGDAQNKWKHIGNDEVHVVWSDNSSKPYTRETIATKFCDVLIVLENVGDNMMRVRVDTASALEFGPLFDGALIGQAELASLVRTTVLNASRAYRLARSDHARPLRHREDVFFRETPSLMQPLALSHAINALYVPSI